MSSCLMETETESLANRCHRETVLQYLEREEKRGWALSKMKRRVLAVMFRGGSVMRSRHRCLGVVLLAAIVVGVSLGACSGTVFIEKIGGYDAYLVNIVRPYMTAWIETTGHSPTSIREGATYRAKLILTNVDASRPFNWWFLLFPLWPIMPVTRVEAEVIVTLTITDANGREVFSNTAGGEGSAFIAADFFSRNWVKRKAFEEAFRRVTVSVYLR